MSSVRFHAVDWKAWDWPRIGLYLEAERGTRTRAEVADAIGATDTSIENAERGRRPIRRKPGTVVALAAYYGWTADSLALVGTGGEPRYRSAVSSEHELNLALSSHQKLSAIEKIIDNPDLSANAKERAVEAVLRRPTADDAAGQSTP